MAPNDRIRRNPQAVFRELTDGTAVLLHLDSTNYHGVNQVGALIWNHLEGEPTVETLANAVRDNLDDPPPDLERDVVEFLTALGDRGLVEVIAS
jgi:actin-like ATPase involved in cell morphogenesis